jgi:dipeptidyl aminopeptidase/acylaminoacyl peptidase
MMLRRVVIACVTLLTAASVLAQPSIESFLRPPEFLSPQLSPDGSQLAVLIPANGRMNLASLDLATRKPVLLTNFNVFDVVTFHWVGNERLVFSLGQLNSATGESYGGGGLFAVKRDGSESRELAPTIQGVVAGGGRIYRPINFVRSVPGSSDEVIVSAHERSVDSVDLYRLNIRTGRKTLLTPDLPDGRIIGWLMDTALVPRVAVAREETSRKRTVYYRAAADAKWEALTSVDEQDRGAFLPLWIEAGADKVLVLGRVNGETSGIYRYDLATRKVVDQGAVHPRFDMSGSSLLLDTDGKRVLGYQLQAERHQVSWTDEDSARAQAMVDKALPDRVNKLQRRPAAGRTLVTSYSDRQSAQYFLFDEHKRVMEELFVSRRWLKPDDLVEMRPFLLKTRDGLEIPSYYFLPKARQKDERLPTVISIHGGPRVRADYWGFESRGVIEAQLLASRGYAVVLPNFRITPGLGQKRSDARCRRTTRMRPAGRSSKVSPTRIASASSAAVMAATPR